MNSYSPVTETMHPSCTFSMNSDFFGQKWPIFPTPYGTQLGWLHCKFNILWYQKSRVPGTSCSTVSIM